MNHFTILNYQGSKNNLTDFLYTNMEPYLQPGKGIFDIFCGSGTVCDLFRNQYPVSANDSETYASIIADTILNQPYFEDFPSFLILLRKHFNNSFLELKTPLCAAIDEEKNYLDNKKVVELIHLYKEYPTVWNQKTSPILNGTLTVQKLKDTGSYYLFSSYYAGNYFGIFQALEIDALIKTIHFQEASFRNVLLSCLFFAMKETVFSKDGHMAQPLNPETNQNKLLVRRRKRIWEAFEKKLKEYSQLPLSKFSGTNHVYQKNFEDLLTPEIFANTGLVYADPPYTDMQYSRYYHLLNVAANYDYPNLTKTKTGYTKGLYTEGRYQSKLSQRSQAGRQLEKLISFCKQQGINLAISYAYPKDPSTQATDRYTLSIDELILSAKKYFGANQVHIATQAYQHANHRNSAQKQVLEYLILCGKPSETPMSITKLKETISKTVPCKKNPLYDTSMYWSQKSFNICDILLDGLSKKNDVIFDPFLGSGVTVLEAVKKEYARKAIGCEINDMPLFIPRTLLSLKNLDKTKEILDDFTSKIQTLQIYYHTQCPHCGGTGIISKVLFNKPERMKPDIEIKEVFYSCTCSKKASKPGTEEDLKQLTCCEKLRNIKNTALIPNSKLAVGKDDDIKNIFTGRNLTVLDHILSIIQVYPSEYQNVLYYILISVLHLCKITDTHSNSQWPLWIPAENCVEKNIIDVLNRKTKTFIKALPFMKQEYTNAELVPSWNQLKPSSCFLLQKGSQHITREELPDNSVDLIITDPPYMGQVLYSEYMQLYRPFVGFQFNLEDEIVVSSAPSRLKDKSNYYQLLDEVFHMCSAKLKENHYLCLYFHDSSLSVWSHLIEILERHQFRFVTQMHIKKTVTLKNIISPKKSLNGDCVLLFIKTPNPIIRYSSETTDEIAAQIIRQGRYMLQTNHSMYTHELYDNGLMEILIQNGWLHKLAAKYSSLVDLFERYFTWDPKESKWKL